MIKSAIITLSCINALVMPSYSHALSLAPTEKIALSKTEFSQIEDIACKKSHKVKAEIINGYQYKNSDLNPPSKNAYVQCQPHGTFSYYRTHCSSNNQQCKPNYGLMHYQTSCSLNGKDWSCDEIQLVTTVNLYERDIQMRTQDMTPESAYGILSKVITYGSFQGTPLDEAIGSDCTFSTSSNNEIVTMNCLATIRVSFWCPQPEITHCPRVLYVGPIIFD